MRTLVVFAALVGIIAPAAAQPPEPTLKVGDKAPPIKATKWLQGKEVASFAEGKVYVMEFWATWCGPCIVMMPHMGELQAQYKDTVTFIGFTKKDQNNPLEKVQAMVEKRGPKLGYTFAYADDTDTYDAWMTAAGQRGIPCCFVVDKAGKLAYIGHPMYLDVVLPKVVEGKWTEKDLEGIKEIEKEVSAVFKATGDMDPEVFLKTLSEFQTKHPALAGIPYFNGARLSSLLKAKKVDEAKKAATQMLEKAAKQEDPIPYAIVSGIMRSPAVDGNKELLTMSLKAAEDGLKLSGDKDWRALLNVAESHFALGDKAKAREFAKKVEAAIESEPEGLKKFVEGQLKKFEEIKD